MFRSFVRYVWCVCVFFFLGYGETLGHITNICLDRLQLSWFDAIATVQTYRIFNMFHVDLDMKMRNNNDFINDALYSRNRSANIMSVLFFDNYGFYWLATFFFSKLNGFTRAFIVFEL